MAKQAFHDFIASQPESLIMLRSAVKHDKDSVIGHLTKLHLMSLLQSNSKDEGGEYQGLNDSELDAEFDTSARTESEIGTGHVDNDKGALGLNNYDYDDETVGDFVRETLAFVDELIAEFQGDIEELR
mmetsp:Transcript_33346/g.30311  ORF Transcript_33346/g.30311 Transcript_33346/m.30311 type:complete len:128 (-) Transcript_33346:691-1074(-)